MNWIDLLLLAIVGASVVSGLMTGLARAVVGLAATVAGIIFGFWSYGMVSGHIQDYVNSRPVANLIGFCLIFFGFVIVGHLVGRILAKFFKWVGMSWFDRLLGGAFGFVRGMLVAVALVTVLLAFAPKPPPSSVVDSRFLPYVMSASDVVAALTPHEIKDACRDTVEKVRKTWHEKLRRPDEARRVEL
jgi:membrane protein required for colicin V production